MNVKSKLQSNERFTKAFLLYYYLLLSRPKARNTRDMNVF